jgi:hypothetical protein
MHARCIHSETLASFLLNYLQGRKKDGNDLFSIKCYINSSLLLTFSTEAKYKVPRGKAIAHELIIFCTKCANTVEQQQTWYSK